MKSKKNNAVEPRKKLHTTTKGFEVELVGVSPYLLREIKDAYENNHPEPTKPQYEIEAMGGEKVYKDHDETTLSTDEEKEAWAKYVADHKEWERGQNERIVEAFILEGVNIEIDVDGQWARRRKRYGIELPTDPDDLKLHYFETEVVGSVQDPMEVVAEIMSLTGIDEGKVEEIRKMFRRNLQK